MLTLDGNKFNHLEHRLILLRQLKNGYLRFDEDVFAIYIPDYFFPVHRTSRPIYKILLLHFYYTTYKNNAKKYNPFYTSFFSSLLFNP